MKIFVLIFPLIFIATAKVLIVVDQKIEKCSKYDKDSYNDLSELDLIPENDTHTFMNGTWKFSKEIKSPWTVHFYAEHYVQGQWLVQAYDRHYKDFCAVMKNSLEPWYYLFKDKQGCPLTAGTKWEFNMVAIQFSPMLLNSIPPHYMGRWRFSCVGEYKENGVVKKECMRSYGDIFDD